MEDHQQPVLIKGDVSIDDRGEVYYVNGFCFQNVKRFYAVKNHKTGFIRAWHAHKEESKYVFVTKGAVLLGAVKIDNWDHPSKEATVHRHVLSSKKPGVLYIPAGYANGFMSLTSDAHIMFFSTSSLDESTKDDIRYDSRYWDIWNIIER